MQLLLFQLLLAFFGTYGIVNSIPNCTQIISYVYAILTVVGNLLSVVMVFALFIRVTVKHKQWITELLVC